MTIPKIIEALTKMDELGLIDGELELDVDIRNSDGVRETYRVYGILVYNNGGIVLNAADIKEFER